MKTDTEGHDRTTPEEEWVPEDDAVIGKAFRWSMLVGAILVLVVLATLWSLRERPEVETFVDSGPVAVPQALRQETAGMPTVAFTDITERAGIDFVHNSGAYGAKLLPETMGGGVAFLDYDNDGDEDLLFVNSADWPDHRRGGSAPMTLYRNDGRGRFDDVTRATGLDVSFYGQGAAVGDYDNDGDVDLFLTALGANHLFRNVDGRFHDVTARAGVAGADDDWSTSAGFFDYDIDGDLDLFVCNYVRWTREIDMRLAFTLNGTDRAYGPPKLYQGVHSSLYRNEGDGTFSDVSFEMGIQVNNPATDKPMGKALAVTFADVDHDGYPDVFVANDTVQNFLFRNNGGRSFSEIGAISGVGFDNQGTATGAMGIDAADIAGDGRLGVAIANFSNETTSFYVQQTDPWQFVDMANAVGVGPPSRLKLSFGLFFFDYDLDGRLDMLQANGHLEDEINEIQPSQHYRQTPQLFWNCGSDGGTCFAAVADEQLGALATPIVGRGAAFADIDADGDLDIVLAQTGGPALLLRNDQQLGRHWLRVRLAGNRGNRDAIGAGLELRAGGRTQKRVVMPTRSYLSQVERTVTFGLGENERVDSLVIRWPGGRTQQVTVGQVDTTLVVNEGS
ncbi:MAG TPA: CRTAC1 family protein [Candidatus Polarisedimenticolaceae bacterium]|nr:CRTAC1 family protein [Candidatus Polarisedimenticolaceae bacterium]